MRFGGDSVTIGAYLREAREKKGLSLRDVEVLTSVSSGHLSMIEQGKVKAPSPRILHELAKAYGLSYIALMKRAGILPSEVSNDAPLRTFAFKGAEKLNDEQRKRIQRLIDLELLDLRRKKPR